jgi:F-type H+-transporting ATPase subunit delta
MSLRTIARSYARAFSDTLPDAAALRRAEAELLELGRALRASDELREFLAAPLVSQELKRETVDKILGAAGASSACRRFVALLVARHRALLAPEIAEELSALVRERLGIVDAEVVSARPLDAGLETQARAALARLTGSEVRATFRVDPAIVGGLRARVGTTIYDGSLRRQLDRMRQRILEE